MTPVEIAARLSAAGYWNEEIAMPTWSLLEAPLKHFQRDAGLPITGMLDPLSWDRLKEVKPFKSSTAKPPINKPSPETHTEEVPLNISRSWPEDQQRSVSTATEKLLPHDFSAYPNHINWVEGETIWVVEKHECKSAHESWQTVYQGKLSRQADNRISVILKRRYGVWFDDRLSGVSEDAWWCIPRKRLCSEVIDFGEWGGSFKPGDMAVFPATRSLPGNYDLGTLIEHEFQIQCEENLNHATATESAFHPDLQNTIANVIKQNHYTRPTIKDIEHCCANPVVLNRYLKALDSYSRFITDRTFGDSQSTIGEIIGLGILILPYEHRLLGVPFEGGPAFIAGFTEPALISAISGVSVTERALNSLTFLTDLKPGSDVLISVTRGTEATTYSIRVAHFQKQAISYHEEANHTSIRVTIFDEASEMNFREFLRKANSRRYPLTIDLRFCSGGSLYSSVDFASLLLPSGLSVATLSSRGAPPETLVTLSGNTEISIPIQVWTSQITASAAEIFIRALARHKPETLFIGSPTAGKCLAQGTFAIAGEGELSLSVYQLQDASGTNCEKQPFVPQRLVKSSEIFNSKAYRTAGGL